ncbi:DUF1707 SHOCT-like domain-containing protein [Nocardioides gilvus]|uniref:DUF1707 SHOCT-like domain-containing protein n=1 Tax=Nocardioides gilvus TaxID=1735589 RepID=UPI0013A58913|nr:DUF1707 domain-containing protein [Nocardioides gilvus]
MVDRDHAVEVINAAYAEGQLTTEQREDRVHRALLATHVGDLDQVTSDLQTAQPEELGSEVAPTSWWGRTSRRTKVAVAGALLVLAGGGLAVAEMGGDSDSVVEAQDPPYVVPATAEAVEELIADQQEEFDTTKSYGVSLQAELSTVAVPTDDGRARYQQWTVGDGTFEASGEVTGGGDQIEFDLAEVDIEALEASFDSAWTTLDVPDPTHATLVIDHWEQYEEPRITINVTNEYDEHGYVVTDLAGRVIEREPFDPTSP